MAAYTNGYGFFDEKNPVQNLVKAFAELKAPVTKMREIRGGSENETAEKLLSNCQEAIEQVLKNTSQLPAYFAK